MKNKLFHETPKNKKSQAKCLALENEGGSLKVNPRPRNAKIEKLLEMRKYKQKKDASQKRSIRSTLSGIRTLDPLIKSQLLYQLS